MPPAIKLSVAARETAEAVKAVWDNQPILQRKFGLLLHGRQPATPAPPYAIISVVPGPTDQIWSIPAGSGNGYQDFQHVTITGRGAQDQMSLMGQNIVSQFWWMDSTGKLGLFMLFPPNAAGVVTTKLMACRPIHGFGDPNVIEDPATKAGTNVWMCDAQFEVWTSRILL